MGKFPLPQIDLPQPLSQLPLPYRGFRSFASPELQFPVETDPRIWKCERTDMLRKLPLSQVSKIHVLKPEVLGARSLVISVE
jgi:hypothetical protein